MKYSNSCLDKKFIKIDNVELSFERNGFYIIKGENGTGKTTLIENVVFDKDISHFTFENENEREMY